MGSLLDSAELKAGVDHTRFLVWDIRARGPTPSSSWAIRGAGYSSGLFSVGANDIRSIFPARAQLLQTCDFYAH